MRAHGGHGRFDESLCARGRCRRRQERVFGLLDLPRPNGGGNQSLNAPRIAGQYDWYLKRQLQAFKDGIRGTTPGDIYGAQMRPMAMTLTNEAAVDNVVAYIGTLTAPPPPATVQGDAAAGKQLYATCAACHGPKAEGNVAMNAPRLADQDDWYLVRQLQNYKKGLRGSQSEGYVTARR